VRQSRARRRSLGSMLVLCCALLAMATYVAFDLMDLDGSGLHDWAFPCPMGGQPQQTDAELLLGQDPSNPAAHGLALLSLAFQLVLHPGKISPKVVAAAFTARPCRINLYARARRSISSSPSPTEDPA
jgi:hypothetical protein